MGWYHQGHEWETTIDECLLNTRTARQVLRTAVQVLRTPRQVLDRFAMREMRGRIPRGRGIVPPLPVQILIERTR